MLFRVTITQYCAGAARVVCEDNERHDTLSCAAFAHIHMRGNPADVEESDDRVTLIYPDYPTRRGMAHETVHIQEIKR